MHVQPASIMIIHINLDLLDIVSEIYTLCLGKLSDTE